MAQTRYAIPSNHICITILLSASGPVTNKIQQCCSYACSMGVSGSFDAINMLPKSMFAPTAFTFTNSTRHLRLSLRSDLD